MLFLPFQMDDRAKGTPFVSVIICIVCCIVFWQQREMDKAYEISAQAFCDNGLQRNAELVMSRVKHLASSSHCNAIFEDIRAAENKENKIAYFAESAKPLELFATPEDNINYISSKLRESYTQYVRKVPKSLTDDLAFNPKDINLKQMLTSVFSHGSFGHLFGNLLMFFIFALSLELLLGSLVFTSYILFTAVGTSLAYSYATIDMVDALPSIGLSGVVMSVIAAFSILQPKAKVCCFFWFIFIIRVFKIPAIALAVWYIGWDVYNLNKYGSSSYVNYVAHVSGAIIGCLVGFFYMLFARDALYTRYA